jgi:PDZ domain-containing protein
VPYFSFAPGSATSVEPLIQVHQKPGAPKVDVDPVDDDLLYVTVSLREPTAFGALAGVLDPKVQVEPSKPYLGNQSSSDNTRLNYALMSDSQDKARKVALERLGYKVKTIHRGVFLEDVDPKFPVAKVLKPGATIVEADGKPVRDRQALIDAIAAHRPGQRIRLGFRALGDATLQHATVKLRERPDTHKAQLGVQPVDQVGYVFPIDVEITIKRVGGPSAGLAFTLAILDRLSPGRLLGHERVAVTGTIELDGSIGPVGGVDHKAEAAIREGAKLFIVPPDEYAQAKKTAGRRLEVEKAATLDQALAILHRFGGDPLPEPAKR